MVYNYYTDYAEALAEPFSRCKTSYNELPARSVRQWGEVQPLLLIISLILPGLHNMHLPNSNEYHVKLASAQTSRDKTLRRKMDTGSIEFDKCGRFGSAQRYYPLGSRQAI